MSGTISGVSYAGGIIKDSSTGIYVTNCFADVTVSATNKGKIYAYLSSDYGTNHIVGNYYNDNGDGVGYSGCSTYTVATSKIAPVYTLTLGSGITTTTEPVITYHNVGYYCGTINLGNLPTTPIPTGYISLYTVNGTSISGTSFTIEADATVATSFAPDPTHFAVNTDGSEYTIKSATGWNVFCDALQDNATYNRFSGKTVKLEPTSNSITVTRMAGSDYHDFCGTFNGQGHTITIDSSNGAYALFHDVSNGTPVGGSSQVSATIQNLHVTGTINVSAKNAAGLISNIWGTVNIENCTSSVTIRSSVNGDGTHGGFAAAVYPSSTLNITGCVFDGKLLTTNTTNGTTDCGGFVGYNGGTVNITNCLYAPQADANAVTSGATFARGYSPSLTNCYYTQTLGTAQGKQRRNITAGDNVTVGHVGDATVYGVSGITAYKDGGTQLPGPKYSDMLYAGSGDQVRLTLSNTKPAGYNFGGYTASAGTLSGSANPYTLTMSDDDVTVRATLTAIPWNGTGTDGDHPYVIIYPSQLDLLAQRVNDGTSDYSGKYFVLGADIAYSHKADNEAGADTESNYTAIGGYFGNDERYFKGHFDGQGHTVSGIRIYDTAAIVQGLFGLTNADIRDITLADARITGYNAGGIVGMNACTVNDCHAAATVAIHAIHEIEQDDPGKHGGIVGYNVYGTVSHCTSAATLTTDGNNVSAYGGIVGMNFGGTMRKNLAIGAVVPATDGNIHGAICGLNLNGIIEHNYYHACKVASNNVTATGVGCGGIDDGNNSFIIDDVTGNNGAVPTLRDDADNSTALDLLAALATSGLNSTPLDLGWGAGKYPMQLAGRTIYRDGDWNTLCLPFALSAAQIAASPLSGTTIMELDGTHSDLTDGTLTLNFNAATEMVAGRPYIVKWPLARTISSSDDWHDFAAAVAGGNTYEGKLVRLDADIEISEMVGTSEYKFKGTFDGQGYTLHLNLSANGEAACAPFRYVDGATIKNLHTTGTVNADNNTASMYRSGLIGQSDGNTTISNCWSSVTISSNIGSIYQSLDGTHGGFIDLSNSGNATISNSLFDGRFSGKYTRCWGGFVGWSSNTTTISNSVFAPEGTSISKYDNATFSRHQVSTTNCYYSEALRDNINYVTNGATAIASRSADDLAADLGSGWQVEDGKAVPIATRDHVNPMFSGVTIDDTNRDVPFTGGSFKGTYVPINFDSEDFSVLFLGTNSTLYFPKSGATIGAQRAYFYLENGAGVREFKLNFGDNNATGIVDVRGKMEDGRSEEWHTLDGRKLSTKPTKKGLYIVNGRKVVVK